MSCTNVLSGVCGMCVECPKARGHGCVGCSKSYV